ncbi:MAG: hypothetical protein LBL60_01195 [Mycoplasmataceae bacterium]|jgi:hypothetical protein|nr:hypothetical protein [Mycoplasmataceae bacterium]
MSKLLSAVLQASTDTIDKNGITILIVVGCVVVFLLLFLIIYMIVAFRKIGIVAKKMDYLVEDLTYKSEMLTPVVEAMIKLSHYVDLFENILVQNEDLVNKFVGGNKKASKQLVSKIKDSIKNDK